MKIAIFIDKLPYQKPLKIKMRNLLNGQGNLKTKTDFIL